MLIFSVEALNNSLKGRCELYGSEVREVPWLTAYLGGRSVHPDPVPSGVGFHQHSSSAPSRPLLSWVFLHLISPVSTQKPIHPALCPLVMPAEDSSLDDHKK